MSTVTVYRVETIVGMRKGDGPYATPYGTPEGDVARKVLLGSLDFGPTRPDPWREPRLSTIAHGVEFCGFTSKRALLRWFTSHGVRTLCESGFFAVCAYEVPAPYVRRGDYQALFEKSKATARRILDHRTLQPKEA